MPTDDKREPNVIHLPHSWDDYFGDFEDNLPKYEPKHPDCEEHLSYCEASHCEQCYITQPDYEYWVKNKYVYQYEPALVNELKKQAKNTENLFALPSTVLLQLPHHQIYMRTNAFTGGSGFLAWLSTNQDTGLPEVNFQRIVDDRLIAEGEPYTLPVLPRGTLGDSYNKFLEAQLKPYKSLFIDVIPEELYTILVGQQTIIEPLHLLLYLLTDNADIIDTDVSDTKNIFHSRSFIKTGQKVNVKTQRAAVSHVVGSRIGAAILAFNDKTSNTTGGSWQHTWKMSTDEKPELSLRWNHPAFLSP